MGKPVPAIMWTHDVAAGASHTLHGEFVAGGVRANVLLDEGPGRLDRAEIVRVRRQMFELCAALFHESADSARNCS